MTNTFIGRYISNNDDISIIVDDLKKNVDMDVSIDKIDYSRVITSYFLTLTYFRPQFHRIGENRCGRIAESLAHTAVQTTYANDNWSALANDIDRCIRCMPKLGSCLGNSPRPRTTAGPYNFTSGQSARLPSQ